MTGDELNIVGETTFFIILYQAFISVHNLNTLPSNPDFKRALGKSL